MRHTNPLSVPVAVLFRLLLPTLLLLLVPSASAVAQGSFTVQDILSAPFPSGLVASPDHELVAWVQDDRGSRNVWVAEGPEWRGRQVTRYEGDDGQEIGSLHVTPDRRIVYVRGGGPNRAGEIPNPVSVAAGADRATWIVDLEGGEPRKVAEVVSPLVSPDGSRIAYARSGTIRIVGLEEGAEPETVADPRGGISDLAWSPEGQRLAFSSSREGHAVVGVLDLEREELRYLDASLDRDVDPTWSPDGGRLAFIRVPPMEDQLPFTPRRESPLPWSIRVVDVESGQAREVWRAEPGPGSLVHGVSGPALIWGAGDHLVFPWEGNGWVNLYTVPVAGGQARPVARGAFEVQHLSVSPDGRRVLFDSNQDDIDRKHVWSAPVDGSAEATLLTPGSGIEWAPVASPGGAVAFMGSGPRDAARAFVRPADGGERVAAAGAFPSSFPRDRLVEPEQVIFPATDGLRIHGQLFLPEDLEAGERRPAVVFFHGGSRRQMLLGFHHRGYYHNTYAFNQYLADRGYVVLSVNYRSGIGYGLEFREALDYGAAGASEFRDVLGAGLYLASRDDVDPERIASWGGSYGGYLTAMALAGASDLFAAGVDLHGVHDWNVVIRNFVPSYDPAAREEVARLAWESSPMAIIDGWRSPVLLIHGDDDRNVPFSESVDLSRILREQGVEVEELVFVDEVHGFLLHRNWVGAFEAAADFLDRKLGSRPSG